MNLRPAAIALGCALCALAVHADDGNPKHALDEARREAFAAARATVDSLRRAGAKPRKGADSGIAAWIADFDRVAAKIDANPPSQRWRALNADTLVGRNPKFWQAVYEAAPSDPAMMMLHGSLLLAAGEATRARYVFVLASQHPQLAGRWRDAYARLAARADAAGGRSRSLVVEGLRLRARRDFPAALEKLTDALIHWPQNALAHWEIGRTLREQAWDAARNPDLPDPPEAVAAFARAREHDPLLLEAYPIGDPALRKRLMALLANRGPTWLRSRQRPDQGAGAELLARLATALQRAGLDELALVAHQALRAQRGADPADQQFISVSLRALTQTAP